MNKFIMKYILQRNKVLIYFLLILNVYKIYGQVEEKSIYITETHADITRIAKAINVQAGLHYSLNMQNSSLTKTITLKAGHYKLSEILKQIKQQANLNYKIIGAHILFVDIVPQNKLSKTIPKFPLQKSSNIKSSGIKSISKLKSSKKYQPVEQNKPQLKSVSLNIEANKLLNDTLPVVKRDSLFTSNSITPSVKLLREIDNSNKKNEPDKNVSLTTRAIPGILLEEFSRLLFIQAGIGADEVYYLNATAQGGFKFLYAIGTVGTTFKTKSFRWGGGVSLKLSETQRIHINYTTGSGAMQTTFYIDTSSKSLKLKETLQRFGMAWSKQTGKKTVIQLQLHYNYLQRKYETGSWYGVPVIPVGDYDKKYYIIEPPYTLVKKENATSTVKSWLGVQCSFFYNFF